MNYLTNQKGQALLFITTILMILSLLSIASLNLVKTEKIVVNDSVEETQAYYVAEAAVEKVLALLKENSEILDDDQTDDKITYDKKGLNSLKNDLDTKNLATVERLLELFNQPYAALEVFQENGESLTLAQYTRAGTIHAIALTKTASDDNGCCTLRIEATGKSGLATRTLVVHVKVVRPLKAMDGVVVQNPPSFLNASEFTSTLTILNGGEFNPKGRFMQSIYINGDCSLQEDTSLLLQAPILVKGNVTISSGAQVEGEVIATGEVLLNEGVLGDPTVSGQMVLSHTFPEFPKINRTWLQKNCDYYYPGDQIIRAEDLKPGIHYIEGNVTLNGNYRGNITLAAFGNITIPHSASLKAQDSQVDSLLLLGYGGVRMDDQAQLTALVFTPETMCVGYNAHFSGILVCRDLESNGATFTQDNDLYNIHPSWHTTDITIVSWQEKYPVFRIN